MGLDDEIPAELLGGKLGIYRLGALIEQTEKSFVFEAREEGKGTPGRDNLVVKVLKPQAERRDQFIKEVQTHGIVDAHDQIATLYYSGFQGDYFFAAMERAQGKDMQREIDEDGRRFSLEELVETPLFLCRASEHIRQELSNSGEESPGHHDLKLRNVVAPKGSKAYLLDLGGKLSIDETYDDVKAIGTIMYTLIENSETRVKEGAKRELKQVASDAKGGVYETPKDLEGRLIGLKRMVSRRRAIRRIGLIGSAAAVAAGLGVTGYELKRSHEKRREYEASLAYAVDQVRELDPLSEEFRTAAKEVLTRISYQKILPTLSSLGKGEFLYAVPNGDKKNFPGDQSEWCSGMTAQLSWIAHDHTGDEQFRELALRKAEEIELAEADYATVSALRFFHSHAVGYGFTRKKTLRNEALEAAEVLHRRFNPHGGYIQLQRGPINDSSRHVSLIDATSALPLLAWAFEQTGDDKYAEAVRRQCETTELYHFNKEDNSIAQAIDFNLRNPERVIGRPLHGFDGISCHSRSQVRAIDSFLDGYKVTNDERFLTRATDCAEYYWDNLPDDFVPFYDFKDPNIPNVPKDTTAAAPLQFLRLYEVTKDEKYLERSKRIMHSLMVQYLITDLDHQGILDKGCFSYPQKRYVSASLIYGDTPFAEALHRI